VKVIEIRALGKVELLKKLEEARQELFGLRLKVATRQLANNREIPKAKRKIARMKTILREQELGLDK
jgi:large subunit ribosomal protein L29